MKRILNVFALPNLVSAEELNGDTVVVIDVLRASTTIVVALDAGAKEVVPCLEVADALAFAKRFPAGECILGGERNGSPIDDFDLGNSPEEYSPDRVEGKTVVFTTTNGTRAMLHAQSAHEVLIAAFVNVSAVVQALLERDRIHILCAGTDGQISEDDVLLAGMLVERLQRQGGLSYEQNAQAMTAREYWLHSFALPKGLGAEPLESELLAERLRTSRGARTLLSLGLGDDIQAAAQMDRFTCVPRFDASAHRIHL
jgi:2-phosphosulfolactate phosphatase